MARFTAADIFRSASYAAPELDIKPVAPGVIVDVFNDTLNDLILDVVDMDEERLATAYEVPADIVAVDPVDLTDDGTGSGAVGWISIAYIDWLDADGVDDEVWIATLEARNRAQDLYNGFMCGVLEDQMNKLRKKGAWTGVSTLRVYGIQEPRRVTEDKVDDIKFDYPSVLRSAMVWEFVVRIAPHAGVKDRQLLNDWKANRSEARQRLLTDARGHVLTRIEEIPSAGGT